MHTAQLMPPPLTVSCFSKIQIGFTFLVPDHPGSPGQRAVKRVCVCVHRINSVTSSSTWPRGRSSAPSCGVSSRPGDITRRPRRLEVPCTAGTARSLPTPIDVESRREYRLSRDARARNQCNRLTPVTQSVVTFYCQTVRSSAIRCTKEWKHEFFF